MHVFSPGRNPFTDNFREVDDKVELVALPTAIYDAFRYKGMIKRRLFHPVLNLQSIDMTEMFHVTCYDNEVFLKCCGSNKHIHITYFLATLLLHSSTPTSLTCSATPCLPLIRAMHVHVSSRYFPCVFIAHQTSTSLNISGPCLNSLAISKGSRSPPQSE